MVMRKIKVVTLMLLLAGCMTTQFSTVGPGQVAVASLSLEVSDSKWNRAPQTLTGYLHSGSEVWTRDGMLLDQLIVVPQVNNGGTLFKSSSDSLVYPTFRQDMLPNEIVELTEGSLAKLMGTNTIVEASGLRPYRLGDQRAVMFDLMVTSADAPRRMGRVLAFVQNDSLSWMTYLGTEIHYFDKHWESALQVMQSAAVAG